MQVVYEMPFERHVERTREYQFSVSFDSTGEERVSEWKTSSTTFAPKLIVFHDDSVKNLHASTV